jgi:hypothetical protein
MRFTAVVAVTWMLAGCHSGAEGDEPTIQRWGGRLADLRVQWTAEPSIDLSVGPAVQLRAYIESRSLAQRMGNEDYAYDGFMDAVPPNEPSSNDIAARERRPTTDYQSAVPLVGNDRYHLLSLNVSGPATAATICEYTYGYAAQQPNGAFAAAQTGTGDSRGIYALRVLMVPPISQSALPPQAGPEPAPVGSVFAGWRITGFLGFFSARLPGFKVVWPTYDADLASCVAKAPDPPERRAFLIDGEHPRSDFPTSPPSPGWPAGGEP